MLTDDNAPLTIKPKAITHRCGLLLRRTPDGDRERCNHPMSARSVRALGGAYNDHFEYAHGVSSETHTQPAR